MNLKKDDSIKKQDHGCADMNMNQNTAMALPPKSKADIGEVKSVRIHCISETGWFDNRMLGQDVHAAGGINTSQYDIPYTQDNLGGYSALIEIEALDGKKTRYLLDSGWSSDWMDHAFAKSGVDRMLESRQIRTMIVSHDHNDHFFGIESTLKHARDIQLYFPGTAMPQSLALLDGADFSKTSGCPKNDFPHTGERIITQPNKLYTLQEGVATALFDLPITLGVRGENVVYVNLKNKGYLIITGCGHPGILTLMDYARRNLRGGDRLYGCYGGLHIAPFEQWNPGMDKIITAMGQSDMKKIACNHCTGRVWAKKAIEAGLPIVKGTDAFLSYKKVSTLTEDGPLNLYTGNGDTVIF